MEDTTNKNFVLRDYHFSVKTRYTHLEKLTSMSIGSEVDGQNIFSEMGNLVK